MFFPRSINFEGGIPQRTSKEEIFMHADPATAEGGVEDGEDDERHRQEQEREAVPHGVQGVHVPGELVQGDTVVVVREGHVCDWMSPPGSIIQAELLSALVDSVEEWVFSVVINICIY